MVTCESLSGHWSAPVMVVMNIWFPYKLLKLQLADTISESQVGLRYVECRL